MMAEKTTIFLGSKPGSAVALEMLVKLNWNVKAVIISKTINFPWYGQDDLENTAKKFGIPTFFQSEYEPDKNVDFVISYMFRHKVQNKILSAAKIAAVNFHAAPLPEYGGWGTYNRAIMEESDFFGATCHYMDEEFDTGPILKVNKFHINPKNLTAHSLEKLAQQEMIKLFYEFLMLANLNKPLPKLKQNLKPGAYLSLEQMNSMKEIPLGSNAEEIDKRVRAFWFPPYSGAFVKIENKIHPIISEGLLRLLATEDGGTQIGLLRKIGNELMNQNKSVGVS